MTAIRDVNGAKRSLAHHLPVRRSSISSDPTHPVVRQDPIPSLSDPLLASRVHQITPRLNHHLHLCTHLPPANPTASNRKEYIPSAAEESAQWRRAGPLPTRDSPAMGSGPRGPGGPGGPGPMSSQFSSAPDSERDWGSARGAKFVPSSNTNGAGAGAAGAGGFGGMRREGSGGGFRREDAPHTQGRYGQGQEGMGPSAADEAGAWRSSKPLVQAPVQQQREREVSAPGLADTESTVRSVLITLHLPSFYPHCGCGKGKAPRTTPSVSIGRLSAFSRG